LQLDFSSNYTNPINQKIINEEIATTKEVCLYVLREKSQKIKENIKKG